MNSSWPTTAAILSEVNSHEIPVPTKDCGGSGSVVPSDIATCSECGDEKLLIDMGIKSRNKRGEIKRDKVCKACLAERARCKRADKKIDSKRAGTTSKGTIEPAKRVVLIVENPRDVETSKIVLSSDFDGWTKDNDTKLSHYEKTDAVVRLNEFISLLREGYSGIIERSVYVSRKD